MILRCHGCQAALKFDEERLKGRRTARCPRCQATLDLPAPSSDGASPRAARSAETVIACSACGARLKAPAGVSATRSRCPRCGSAVSMAVGATFPAQTSGPARAASAEGEENSSAATRRIDSRSFGMSVPGAPSPMPPPSSMASLDPIASPAGDSPGDPSTAAPRLEAEASPGVSLTRPPVAPLREAALDIQAAARAMNPAATVAVEPAPVPAAPAPHGEPSHSKESAPAPAARVAAPATPAARPGAHAEARHFTPYPLTRGGFSGLAAGAAVGGALWGAEGWLWQKGLGWLMGPLFSGLPDALTEPMWRLCLLALAGTLAGLIAAGAGSPGRQDRPLSIRRCAGSALLPGVLLGMLAILVPSRFPEGAAIWPAVNWMRDLLLAGLLTPAVNRVLPGQR